MLDRETPSEISKEHAAKQSNKTADDLSVPITRRGVLSGFVVAASTAFAARWGKDLAPNKTQPLRDPLEPIQPTPIPTHAEALPTAEIPLKGEDQESSSTFESPFISSQANEIATRLGYTAGEFFSPSENTVNELHAFQSADLLPIFPPSVIQYKELIKKLSVEFDIPPNVIATIMTLESGGDKNAGVESKNPEAAHGLFQVIPANFPETDQDNLDYMLDITNNSHVAMDYLATTCLPHARELLAPRSPDHASVYARALMNYNGGPGNGMRQYDWTADERRMPLSDRPDVVPAESKKYADFFLRFAMTAEVADGLRQQGCTDAEIVKKLCSTEIDARAYALHKFYETYDNSTYFNYKAGYNLVSTKDIAADKSRYAVSSTLGTTPPDAAVDFTNFLSLPIDNEQVPIYGHPEMEAQASQVIDAVPANYNDYLKNPEFEFPYSAGLRIWSQMGGIGNLAREANHDLNWSTTQWDNLSTT